MITVGPESNEIIAVDEIVAVDEAGAIDEAGAVAIDVCDSRQMKLPVRIKEQVPLLNDYLDKNFEYLVSTHSLINELR